MTTEYVAPARLRWPAKTPRQAAAFERFRPSTSVLKITYLGCGVALALGLVMGLVLRPDYAAGDVKAGPRLVVSSAQTAAAVYPDYIPAP